MTSIHLKIDQSVAEDLRSKAKFQQRAKEPYLYNDIVLKLSQLLRGMSLFYEHEENLPSCLISAVGWSALFDLSERPSKF